MRSEKTTSKRMNDPEEIKRKIEERRKTEAASEDPEAQSNKDKPPRFSADFLWKCFHANERGDGLLFVETNKGRLLFDQGAGRWMRWSGHTWEEDRQEVEAFNAVEAGCVQQGFLIQYRYLHSQKEMQLRAGDQNTADLDKNLKAITQRIHRLRSVRGIEKTLVMASKNPEPRIYAKPEELDSDPWVMGAKNGVVDLRTGIRRDGRREDFITRAVTVDYLGPDVPSPVFEEFLISALEDPEKIACLQRVLGYGLTGLNTEHIMPILVGRGRNGKGTLVETLLEILGRYSTPVPSELLIKQRGTKSAAAPSPEILALRGVRLALASETEDGAAFSASKVKWLSGADTLVGRHPYERDQVTFRPSHLLLLNTNHLPAVSASDFAFWERCLVFDFPFSFVNRTPKAKNERRADPNLREKLREEYPGILAWLVRGCLAWQREGINPPASITEATAAYRRDQDILADFIEECCVVHDSAEGNPTALYDAYVSWWESRVSKKKEPWSQHKFGKELGKRFERGRTKTGGKCYLGIGVKF